ncbi:MAG: ribosome biogenesis GTP-binding protein YihA/YsxC [Flintibacter sp.]|uniref:ribosome biogenesis GTP-binding protein YihA/YsxC n=1 Tax=Flintibacter sp. TaxID=1918624 RepID=UPI00267292DB|nr:ribosome biogenesis GTP-binding protein YihA/YsxC [Flintibacter sp.]MCI6151160.1 ribosome biogenesis GTP-binding protein YihA/YsxC [Flintibacter sp.]MDD7117108.1 ribosome biogenesis GTP-binding protein YihA/YsxC [Flintibacter sp.]MDY5037984.1 ribosome biogenesis GTP-binding protein YihA/YsxC [Lawsonibacter sp.]
MAINLQKAEFILSAVAPKFFMRDGLPQVAFSGRSNVGKSSVINRLLNRKNFARVGAAPGKTTQINYFKIDNAFYLVDLPGYGYAKVSKAERDRWGKLMESYFADPELMTLGVMIVDSRHKPTADDCTMAQWYREAGCPFVVVANKLDKLKKSQVEPNLQVIRETLELGEGDVVIPFSAEKGTGRQELVSAILASVEGRKIPGACQGEQNLV